jgi:hypothetical protein
MAYCTNCGTEYQEGQSFCGSCGRPVGNPDPATLTQAAHESQEPQEPSLAPESRTAEPTKASAAPLIAVMIPVFALMGVALLVGPERLGFAMGSSVLTIIGLVLIFALLLFLLWAAGKLVGKNR